MYNVIFEYYINANSLREFSGSTRGSRDKIMKAIGDVGAFEKGVSLGITIDHGETYYNNAEKKFEKSKPIPEFKMYLSNSGTSAEQYDRIASALREKLGEIFIKRNVK